MTTQDLLPYDAVTPGEARVRDLLVAALRLVSRALDALAHRMTPAPKPPALDPVLEFYGDASAPEGALYVDGRLVGQVLGANRL
jgi:hypothetical protein